jgi:hypothetical protein
VRYEDFQTRPVELCRRMFHFFFLEDVNPSLRSSATKDSPYHWTASDIDRICVELFPALKPTAAPSPFPARRGLKGSVDLPSMDENVTRVTELEISRSLKRKYYRTKLIGGDNYHLKTSLGYNPDFIHGTCDYNMASFSGATSQFPEDLTTAVKELSGKLAPYGYTLDVNNFYQPENKFSKWNLMKE